MAVGHPWGGPRAHLLDETGHHCASHDGGTLARKAERDELHAGVFTRRKRARLRVHLHQRCLRAHHHGKRRAVHVGVEDAHLCAHHRERVREVDRRGRLADAALARGHRDARADVLEPRRLPRIDAPRGRCGAEVDRERALQRLGKLAREMGGTHVGQLATLRMRRSREREHDVQPFPATLRFVDARYAARDDVAAQEWIENAAQHAQHLIARVRIREIRRGGVLRDEERRVLSLRARQSTQVLPSQQCVHAAPYCVHRATPGGTPCLWLEPVRTFPHNEWVII